MENNKKHLDFVTSIVLGLLSIYVLLESVNINAQYYQRPQHGDMLTSPSLTPTILGIALLLCAVLLCVRSLRGVGIKQTWADIGESFRAFCSSKLVLFSVIGLLYLGLYVFVLLEILPFAVASLIFLFGLLLMLKATNWWKSGIIAALSVTFIVVLFQVVFHIRLP